MFFELQNGKVVVTDQGLMNESVRKLYEADHSKGKERFTKMGAYIYSVYDKRSIYRQMNLLDRQKLVSADVIGEPGYWRNAEKNESFIKIISKLNELQFTHKERLLEGVKKKIDDYLRYFDELKISEENHKNYQSIIKGSEDLLNLYDRLDQMVNEESHSRQVGGGESKMFEDG